MAQPDPPVYSGHVADLPFQLPDPGLADLLARALDVEGKIPRALDSLGPLATRDVVLLDGARGLRARQLVALGARVIALERPAGYPDLVAALEDGPAGIASAEGEPCATGLPDASVDALVACWSAVRGAAPAEVGEADRILRPGGRLLALHDYGRDDVSRLHPADRAEYTSWSRRDGPFLGGGFKVRVIHCWWTFDSLEEATTLLREGFGAEGDAVAAGLVRPRLSYNVAIYHRTRPDGPAA